MPPDFDKLQHLVMRSHLTFGDKNDVKELLSIEE